MPNSRQIVIRYAVAFCIVACFGDATEAQVQRDTRTPEDPLLVLVRDSAVHQELQLTQEQHRALLQMTDDMDGPLMELRGKPRDQGVKVLDRLREDARKRLASILTADQQRRLDEITLRVQGIRSILRSDVSTKLDLSHEQATRIRGVVDEKEKQLRDLRAQSPGSQGTELLQKQILRLREEEQREILAVLDPKQQLRFKEMVGASFDTSKLGQIAYKAPGLSSGGQWINSRPLDMGDLRGKVVALHFWAFG